VARLKRGGIFVTQAGSGSPFQIQFQAKLKKTLERFFKVVRPYYAFVPSFGVPWAFLIATQRADPRALSSLAIDKRLGTISRKLRFYDGQTHEGLFRISKSSRALLK
jgi:spermidine synthase